MLAGELRNVKNRKVCDEDWAELRVEAELLYAMGWIDAEVRDRVNERRPDLLSQSRDCQGRGEHRKNDAIDAPLAVRNGGVEVVS
jgi:hypothetical protein